MGDVSVVIVVGMHRAGTSAIARGLPTMGIDLGDNLFSPAVDNPKGYWEDKTIVDIDNRLLSSLGHSWHSYGVVEVDPPTCANAYQLFFDVVQCIREYTSHYPIWGFKDPRSARLLPFWQAVFEHLESLPGYVIALRNPLSVARSLEARNGFALPKSYLLWLEHYLCAFKYTRGCPVVVVDYDRLLEAPSRELDRVVARLGLVPDRAQEALKEEYLSQFLEHGLRHTQFVAQDVSIAPSMFAHVAELYAWGYKLATDQISTDDEDFHQFLVKANSTFNDFMPALHYINGIETELQQVKTLQETSQEQIVQMQGMCDRLGTEVGVRDRRVGELEQTLAAHQAAHQSEVTRLGTEVGVRDRRVGELEQALAAHQAAHQSEVTRLGTEVGVRDRRVGELEQALAAHQSEVTRLGTEVGVRGRRVGELEQALAAHQSEVTRLGTEVGVRDRRVGELEQALTAHQSEVTRLGTEVGVRDRRVGELEQALAAQRRETTKLAHTLHILMSSTSWRLTQPLRKIFRNRPRLAHSLYRLLQWLWWTITFRLPSRLRASVRLRRHIKTLTASGLFDTTWYLAQNPDVAAVGIDPLVHYLHCGAQEGRNPHPLFDTAWYLAQNADVVQAGVNPLWHYATAGWQEGRNPHPLFDTRFYLEQYPDVVQAGVNPLWHYATAGWQEGRNPHPLFDTRFYLEQYPDVVQAGVNPLWHYATTGWRAGCQPHPLCDTNFYLTHNPDVVQAGVNPLWHYATAGWQEGRNPHPLFDTAWYLAQNADVVQAGVNPLWHYTTTGWQEGRNPHPLFDTRFYLEQYPDVVQAGVNPLWHYATTGWRAGCQPHPLCDTNFYLTHNPDVTQAGVNPLWHYATAGWQEGRNPHPLFDTRFYLDHHPDVVQAGVNPLWHYATAGWQEGHNPHPLFDTRFYLEQYPDVVQAGVNPLWHYATTGWQAGRQPHPLFDTRFYLEQYSDVVQAGVSPLWHYTTEGWRAGRQPHPLFDTSFDLAGESEPEMFPDLSEPAVKLIAFYLPQFHPIPENDRWWGKGFTEWSNVSKARPLFPGHYQPHLPGELGFYDLRLVEVIQRQIKLAKQYGLYGFCLYLYWFQGKRLLERPVEQFLAHPELDFPFCLCWANENWTRRWDGQDNEVLIGQEYSPDDDLAFIRDIEPYLRDPRYIRIDGKPLLLVYNPGRLPDAQGTVSRWREYCHSTGIGDLFLVMAQTFGIIDPRPFGFDAAVEFPPHNTHMASRACDITHTIRFFEPGFTGGVYDYADIVRGYPLEPTEYLLFKGVMLGWDNTARRDRRASIFVNSSPKVFQKWLENVMQWTLQHQMPTQRLVFINAWNEWAEGTHLEPDRQYGYAYLNATARALQRVAVKVCIPQKHTVWIENSSKHSRLPEKIRTLDDKAWLNLLLKSVSTTKIDQVEFPGFPSPELQSTFVGSINEATLQEAFSFYVFVKKYAEELGNPLRREHRFLDFGCGWGRYLRFFWKDIDENNLYGCDVNQHVLDICRTLNVPGHLALIDPEGDLPYPDSHFDTIMAYSVFTHLPERVHLHWMRELARVARPGCVFCLTLEPRRFIDFIASISPDTNTHQWHKLIAKFKPQVDEFYRIFDSGEMVFMQTNEDLEVQGTYGDAVVPLSFINREWSSYFTVHAYIDNPQEFWQAVLVTQRL